MRPRAPAALMRQSAPQLRLWTLSSVLLLGAGLQDLRSAFVPLRHVGALRRGRAGVARQATDNNWGPSGCDAAGPSAHIGARLGAKPARRRSLGGAVAAAAAAAAGLAALVGAPGRAVAEGLRAKLAKRSGKELISPIFNIPPQRQVYPDWLEGTWLAEQQFAGFVFPVLPKEQVLREVDVPGFKTCSIVDFADVGKTPVEYEMRWQKDGNSVVEDWPFNLRSTVSGHLPQKGNVVPEVTSVQYSPDKDPNRLSMTIKASRNAERVELFVNARDSEAPADEPDVFFCSEYRRQVTFSSRVLQGYNGNYQHFRTFQRLSPDTARLNVLTASYIDPLNGLYFQTIDKPVVVFSHEIRLSRRAGPGAGAA